MKRTPERRQLMDEVAQAKAYAESDFTIPHDRFINLFGATHPTFSTGQVLDIGCGNGDPTIRFAKRFSEATLVGIDGSSPMLNLAKETVEFEGLSDRVRLYQGLIGEIDFFGGSFDAIICNSVLHHLNDSMDLWNSVKFLKKGGAFFAMDLTRPPSKRAAKTMLKEHAGDPKLMLKDFYASLRAAYRPEEVRDQLDKAGLEDFHVEVVSNRHMAIHGVR